MEERFKHMEMIQGIINRLSTNSFLLKGWSVVVVSALFALSAKDSKVEFAYLAFFPAFAFWALDGYFLWQERLFRELYDQTRVAPVEEIDFSMSVTEFKANSPGWIRCSVSSTLLLFHGTVTAIVIAVAVLVKI